MSVTASLQSESAVRTTVSTDIPTGDYNIFDGSTRYAAGMRSELRVGIDNLFDVAPEITLSQAGGYTNTGDTNEDFYDSWVGGGT